MQTETSLRDMISCAIKTGVLTFVEDPDTNVTVAQVADHQFPIAGCGMENMKPNDVRIKILNKPGYRDQVEEEAEISIDDVMASDKSAYNAIVTTLEQAYILPDETLHLCVGFYENGDFKTNTVKGKNLPNNIEYNRFLRPGRFYYVDGEYVCGGMLKKEFMPDKIRGHKARIHELGLKPKNYDTAPYV